MVANNANVPPMQLRGPDPNGVYVKSRPPAMRRLIRSICIAMVASSASAPALSRASRSAFARRFSSVKRSGSKASGSAHTRGLRPIAHELSRMKSPGRTSCPEGSTSRSSTRRGKRLMGAYLRSDSFTTRCVYGSLPSCTSLNVGARPFKHATSSATFLWISGIRLKWCRFTVRFEAVVRCPAAMMSFTSPHTSSRGRGSPFSSVARSSESSRQ